MFDHLQLGSGYVLALRMVSEGDLRPRAAGPNSFNFDYLTPTALIPELQTLNSSTAPKR